MKQVFVITSTRADYGLLKPVIKRLKECTEFKTVIAATGTHLKSEYGSTLSEIEKDGFAVDYKINILKDTEKYSDLNLATAKIISYTVDSFSQLFSWDRPDLVLVLGDRYEIFAVCTAASAMGIPIAHISGGDVTIGAKDDFYRHCITQMANIHFPSCQDSYNRLLRLGQNPNTVFNVGGLGDENIKNTPLLSLEQLEESLEFSPLQPFFLITYHPETQKGDVKEDMENLFAALDKMKGYNLIFTKSNADAGGLLINQMVDEYCQNNPRAKAFFSLGLTRYLSAMKLCAAVVGNSSSGVVETPTFKVPCVNIGDRQKGRYIAQNVICAKSDKKSILSALKKAVSDEFIQKAKEAKSPYDAGCTPSEEIVKHIKEYLKNDINTVKIFYDGE